MKGRTVGAAVGAAVLVTTLWADPAIASRWFKPGEADDPRQRDRDRYECFREAATVPQIPLPDGPPRAHGSPRGGFSEGFERGRELSDYHARIDQADRQEEKAVLLFVMCMRSRGYSLRER